MHDDAGLAAPPRSLPTPSFGISYGTCRGTGGRVAFCFSGQPRTFVLPATYTSLISAVVSFSAGAEADTFFYLTDDDNGDSAGNGPAGNITSTTVHEVMSLFRPKAAYYGPFNAKMPGPHPGCVFSTFMNERRRGATVAERWWATWEKRRRSFILAQKHEKQHNFLYSWFVQLRVDLWFFGEVPPHCQMSDQGVGFPAGVVGCSCSDEGPSAFARLVRGTVQDKNGSYTRPACSRCHNDHLAFVPQHVAQRLFDIARDIEWCSTAEQFVNFTDLGARYLWSKAESQHLLPTAPSPIVPYTLMRQCKQLPLKGAADCMRWRWTAAAGTGWPQITSLVMREHYQKCLKLWSAQLQSNKATACPALLGGKNGHHVWYFC